MKYIDTSTIDDFFYSIKKEMEIKSSFLWNFGCDNYIEFVAKTSNFQDYVKNSLEPYFTLRDNYYNVLRMFLKEKRKIEARERIKKVNEAKSDFMASLRVCSDVKRHIFSFL